MTTGASFARGSSRQDYATPRDFISAVERRFGPLSVDLAASSENTKAPIYLTVGQDSLSADWTRHFGNLWLNPPFANIAPWAAKCAAPHTPRFFRRILFLVPASVGANWFADHVAPHARIYFLVGRLCFDGRAPFPKDCCLAVYGEPVGVEWWRWRLDAATAGQS
jgi:phage N-6-adenine-methyltransferase